MNQICRLLLLTAVAWLQSAPAICAGERPVPAVTPVTAPAIGAFLDDAGKLALPPSFSGNLDPSGFQMQLDADGSPRFLPAQLTAGTATDPDSRWAGGFDLPSGCDGPINAVVAGDSGEFYVGGSFVSCGGVLANNVARYEPGQNSWSALGSAGGNGVSSEVETLALMGGDLYVGGNFFQANVGAPINATRIARWNGNVWAALGSGAGNGLNGTVLALAATDSDLYVGGGFTQANVGAPVTANRIARWNGSTWSVLGSGGGNGLSGAVRALVVSGSDVYAGGDFIVANLGAPISARRIAHWNGSVWSALGNGGGQGLDDSVQALAISGGDLFAGGNFTQANVGAPITANRVARWDGSAWAALGSGGGNGIGGIVNALAVSGADLYVGGFFTQANVGASITANRLARWAGGSWSSLGTGAGNGVDGNVNALLASGSDLYVGGSFGRMNVGAPIAANGIARWTGSAWTALGSETGQGVNNLIRVLLVSGSDLYVGGSFGSLGSVDANNVAHWDGSTWSALGSGTGNGVNSTVFALALSGGDLFVGGNFNQANMGSPIPANGIARWNGSVWSALGSGAGNGVNGTVAALVASGSDLYVGGGFTVANVGAPIAANHIARWDGNAWSSLGSGNGLNSPVLAMAVAGNNLYVGGSFTEANVGSPVIANRIAVWNGSVWSALGSGGGNGLSGDVRALAISGTTLYVGGEFTEANLGASVSAHRVARWNGASWTALSSGTGEGLNNSVFALAVFGDDVYVGGFFTQANVGAPISANRIARWNGSTWSTLGSGTSGTVEDLAIVDADTLYAAGSFLLAGGQPSSRIGRYRTRGTLDLSLTGVGSGQVQSNPVAINCPGTCAAALSWDQAITLTATAAPGSVFSGWSGGICTGTAACVLNFDQDTSITANFEAMTYNVTPSASPGGSITPDIAQHVPHGQTAAFTLASDNGFYLDSITGSCGGAMLGHVYTTEPILADCTVVANFAAQIISTTTLLASANPVRTGQLVSFDVSVSGASAPLDGQVTITASTTETCMDSAPLEVSGNSASFSCAITFATLGPRTLSASFGNSATHQDSSSAPLNFSVARFADLSVSVSDGQTIITPGQALDYLIEVRNSGPEDAPDSVLVLASAPSLLGANWTCSAVGAAVCPSASGNGELSETFSLPAGAGLDFIQNGTAAKPLSSSLSVLVGVTGSSVAPNFVFDPDSSNNDSSDVNLAERLFADGFEN